MLQQKVRTADIVARLGGDEFAVLLHNCGRESALHVADNLLKAVDEFEFVWGIEQVHARRQYRARVDRRAVQAHSAGPERSRHGVLRREGRGRNRIVVHQADALLVERQNGEMAWVARAKRALAENRLFLEAQLIQPLSKRADGSEQLPHYEMLVRMRDENGRSVPPGAFLPAVERYNLSVRYDKWVIGAALKWMSSNPGVRHRVGRFFINLSRDSVADGEMAEFIRQSLATSAVDPRHVGFETSESIAIGNLGKANQLITTLRRMGCSFGLDDFGSGVSSFAYLKALGADYLKIDGMFVGNIAQDRVDYAMVRSIKDIGHVMGKQVIAESRRERSARSKNCVKSAWIMRRASR